MAAPSVRIKAIYSFSEEWESSPDTLKAEEEEARADAEAIAQENRFTLESIRFIRSPA